MINILKAIILTTSLSLNPNLEKPQLKIAQGLKESGMNQYAVGRCGEYGAFQVIKKYHGTVPKDLKGQSEQYDRIMNDLIRESKNNVFKSVVKYNGRGEKAVAYAKSVRLKAIEIQIIGI